MDYSSLSALQIQSLTRLWQSIHHTQTDPTESWEKDIRQVYDLGLGMQEVMQFLYEYKPDLPGFLQWVHQHSHPPGIQTFAEEDVLSASDLEHWDQYGYVVVRNAVSKEACQEANSAIWTFLEADVDDPESWYKPHPAKNGLMVVFTQHQALENIRQSVRIRKAYEQLYGTTSIYRVVDKVSFNPPENDHYRFAGSPLHWDTSLECPIPYRLQGLLYLTDVTAEGGAFRCVPGFHRQIDTWIKSLPAGTDLRQHALKTLQPVPVPGHAGDFIIWHQALPHGASPNHGRLPRLVQYLTYIPDQYEDHRAWI